MPYSAVTQPLPLPRSQEGRLVSTEAVHSTRVSPKATRQLPSAWRVKPGSMTISRIWSGARPEGRMEFLSLEFARSYPLNFPRSNRSRVMKRAIVLAACALALGAAAPRRPAPDAIAFEVSSWGKPLVSWRVAADGRGTHTNTESGADFQHYRLVTRRIAAGPDG